MGVVDFYKIFFILISFYKLNIFLNLNMGQIYYPDELIQNLQKLAPQAKAEAKKFGITSFRE